VVMQAQGRGGGSAQGGRGSPKCASICIGGGVAFFFMYEMCGCGMCGVERRIGCRVRADVG
jgi:hypothetical protein